MSDEMLNLIIAKGFQHRFEIELNGNDGAPLDIEQNDVFAAILGTDDFANGTTVVTYARDILEASDQATRVMFSLTDGTTGSLPTGDPAGYLFVWVVGRDTDYEREIQYRGKVTVK